MHLSVDQTQYDIYDRVKDSFDVLPVLRLGECIKQKRAQFLPCHFPFISHQAFAFIIFKSSTGEAHVIFLVHISRKSGFDLFFELLAGLDHAPAIF